MAEHVFDKYLREDKLKTMWCPGCGNGIVLQAIIRALDESGVDQDKVVIVSGVGCSSRAVNYLDACGLHTNHGRPIAYATGVKMANPELTVIVITGDGDCASIGGNHFIHGCRRNIDLTVVCMNNDNYGMTGGQYSPTTPEGSMTKTSVYGSYEPPFDLCDLAVGAGATYVARGLTYYPVQLKNAILKGIQHKVFSFIDAMSDCVSLYGRLNKLGDAATIARHIAGLRPEPLANDSESYQYGGHTAAISRNRHAIQPSNRKHLLLLSGRLDGNFADACHLFLLRTEQFASKQ